MNCRRLRAIFFDLDDTLIETSRADSLAFEAVKQLVIHELDLTHPTAELVISDLRVALSTNPWDPADEEHVWSWRRKRWQRVLERHCFQVSKIDTSEPQIQKGPTLELLAWKVTSTFRDVRLQNLKINAQTQASLEQLKSRGILLAIITNGHTVVQREKLAACGAYRMFESHHIFVGGEEELAGRMQKPSSSIFERVCTVLDVERGEVLHVGDNWDTDILGASAARLGWSVWLTTEKETLCNCTDCVPSATFISIHTFLTCLIRELDVDECSVCCFHPPITL